MVIGIPKGGVMKKWILFLSVVAASFSLLLANAPAGELKIGTVLDHSGALKDWGPHHRDAVILAFEQTAAAGFPVVLVHEDSQSAAEPAIEAAKRLVETEQVVAIIGSASSGVIVPLAETVTCPKGVLLISPGATSPFITGLPGDQDKDLLFRTCPSDTLQGVVLAKLAASQYKTASILYVNNPYGQGLAQQFHKSFHKRGGTVFTMVPHGEEVAKTYVPDLRKAYARVYQTKPFRSGRSDVLCVFSYPEHAKVYVKEAAEVFHARTFLFCDGSKSEALAEAVGPQNLEGQMGTAPAVAVGEGFGRFSAAYGARFDTLPVIPFVANAYDAAAVLGLAAFAAQARGGDISSTAIRDQMRQVASPPGVFIAPGQFAKAFELLREGKQINYEGASGSVDFDPNGDVEAPIEIWRFSEGRIVTDRIEYRIPAE
jgi:ABC-type branched-subunit amino acid transport system substrate-binding protein